MVQSGIQYDESGAIWYGMGVDQSEQDEIRAIWYGMRVDQSGIG